MTETGSGKTLILNVCRTLLNEADKLLHLEHRFYGSKTWILKKKDRKVMRRNVVLELDRKNRIDNASN